MIRDLKADCAKRTEEVCSGFCNIGSGISLKRQKWHQKAKNCFLVFFLCSGWRKEGRQEQPLIDYKRAGMRETKWKLKNKENDVERERSVYVPFLCFWKMIKEGQWRKEWKRAYPWICRLLWICSGGNWRNNSGNAGIQGFCEEPAFKADIKYAGHYPVLWSPVPVWNNPKEPSDREKVFFCEQWRAWRYWSGDWDEAGEFSRLRKEVAGKRNIQKILLVNIW